MNLFILALFSLFLTVCSESEIEDQNNEDTSLYDTILSSFYDDDSLGVNWDAPAKQKTTKNQRVNSNKNNNNQARNKKPKNNRGEVKDIKIDYKISEPDIIGYVGEEPRMYKGKYNYKLVGRQGLGFDLRTATTYGLKAPLTPKLLEVVGQNYLKKKNEEDVYPLII